MQLSKHIVLIGPMGVGKTVIGRHLARRLDTLFADSDQEIKRHTGVSIATIFEIEGEAGFRDRETQIIQQLLASEPKIIAAGGGSILREENRQWMCSHATVVYLKASVGQQLRHTRHDDKRPLLQTANVRATLENLMRVRSPLYVESADITINTQGRSISDVTHKILITLREQKIIE